MKKDNKYLGTLICFEGIDGCGKSTLSKLISKTIMQEYPTSVIHTREPGGTPFGKKLGTLLTRNKGRLSDQSEFLLFAADRADHFAHVVIPALQQGALVVSDRMADSSLAYQGFGRGLDRKMIRRINQWVMHNIEPDLVFYLKIDIVLAHKRMKQRKKDLTRIEKEKLDFWKRTVQGYEKIFNYKKNVIFLDASQAPEYLCTQVLTILKDKKIIPA